MKIKVKIVGGKANIEIAGYGPEVEHCPPGTEEKLQEMVQKMFGNLITGGIETHMTPEGRAHAPHSTPKVTEEARDEEEEEMFDMGTEGHGPQLA